MRSHPWHTHRIRIHKKHGKGRYSMTDPARDKLMKAMFSLHKSIEHQLMLNDNFEGVADAMVNNYRTLHSKIAELYEDDYYITDVLKLDVPEDATDKQKVLLVQLAASQMATYMKSMAREERRERFRGPGGPPPHWKRDEERDFGRELSDEIMNFTKETLRRALDSLDIMVEGEPPEPPPPPEPPKRKRKPDIDIDEDDII
jgi:hypothetical protein